MDDGELRVCGAGLLSGALPSVGVGFVLLGVTVVRRPTMMPMAKKMAAMTSALSSRTAGRRSSRPNSESALRGISETWSASLVFLSSDIVAHFP